MICAVCCLYLERHDLDEELSYVPMLTPVIHCAGTASCSVSSAEMHVCFFQGGSKLLTS